MMDWLGQMLRLPEAFLAQHGGEGGGVIQVRCGRVQRPGVWAPRGSTASRLPQKEPSCAVRKPGRGLDRGSGSPSAEGTWDGRCPLAGA